jgi:hypothetical protein
MERLTFDRLKGRSSQRFGKSTHVVAPTMAMLATIGYNMLTRGSIGIVPPKGTSLPTSATLVKIGHSFSGPEFS